MEDTIQADKGNDLTANFGAISTNSNPLDQSMASTAQSSVYTGPANQDDADFASPFCMVENKKQIKEKSLTATGNQETSLMSNIEQKITQNMRELQNQNY